MFEIFSTFKFKMPSPLKREFLHNVGIHCMKKFTFHTSSLRIFFWIQSAKYTWGNICITGCFIYVDYFEMQNLRSKNVQKYQNHFFYNKFQDFLCDEWNTL